MAAYRCEQCDIDWPHQSKHYRCAQCNGVCAWVAVDGMDADETKSTLRHIEFERYYTDRETTKLAAEIEAHGVTPPDDPSPKGPMSWRFPRGA